MEKIIFENETPIDINIDDINGLGIFDGSYESISDLVTSIAFMTPVSWLTTVDDEGKINKIYLYNKEKMEYIENEIKPKDSDPFLTFEIDDGWITAVSFEPDLKIEIFKTSKEDVINTMAKIISTNNDNMNPDFLKYSLEALFESKEN